MAGGRTRHAAQGAACYLRHKPADHLLCCFKLCLELGHILLLTPTLSLTVRPPHRFMRDFDPEMQAGGKEGRTKMRDACERALTAGGLHVTGACMALG